MKLIGICGGDARNRYLLEQLEKMGYPVAAYDLVSEAVNSVQEEKEFFAWIKKVDILVGATPLQRYQLPYCDTRQTWERFEMAWRAGMQFFAGGIPKEWKERAELAGVQCIDFLKQPEYQQLNARLTAEGTLGELILHYPGEIADTPILVTGYGSCGKEIARLLQRLGARVTVCVRRIEMAWQAVSDGMNVCYFDYMKERLPEFTIIVNTVPAKVFQDAEISEISKAAMLIEIASGSGGFDEKALRRYGLMVKNCPGLPGKYAPLRCAQGMLGVMEKVWTAQEKEDEAV